MTYDEIAEKVNEFLVEEFEVDPEVIKPEAPMKESLGLDSLDYVDMVVVIEETFGFKVKTEDFQQIDTFDTFYKYIMQQMEQPKQAV